MSNEIKGDYISRAATRRKLRELFDTTEDDIAIMPDVMEVLGEIPAADVAPVVHGEWILRHVGHGHYWECSVCHTNPCIYVTENTNYCPSCGALMDGKEQGDD